MDPLQTRKFDNLSINQSSNSAKVSIFHDFLTPHVKIERDDVSKSLYRYIKNFDVSAGDTIRYIDIELTFCYYRYSKASLVVLNKSNLSITIYHTYQRHQIIPISSGSSPRGLCRRLDSILSASWLTTSNTVSAISFCHRSDTTSGKFLYSSWSASVNCRQQTRYNCNVT